jgi:hypothetical protein
MPNDIITVLRTIDCLEIYRENNAFVCLTQGDISALTFPRNSCEPTWDKAFLRFEKDQSSTEVITKPMKVYRRPAVSTRTVDELEFTAWHLFFKGFKYKLSWRRFLKYFWVVEVIANGFLYSFLSLFRYSYSGHRTDTRARTLYQLYTWSRWRRLLLYLCHLHLEFRNLTIMFLDIRMKRHKKTF